MARKNTTELAELLGFGTNKVYCNYYSAQLNYRY